MASAALSQEEGAKWHGEARLQVSAPLDSLWKIASVFCGLKQWVPTMEICDRLEGEEGVPGCLRYVAGHTFPRKDGQKTWAKERLVAIDNAAHSFSYVMEDGNMGLKGYRANFQLSEGSLPGTAVVEWSFEMNPIDNIPQEVVVQKQIDFLNEGIHDLQNAALNGTPAAEDPDQILLH